MSRLLLLALLLLGVTTTPMSAQSPRVIDCTVIRNDKQFFESCALHAQAMQASFAAQENQRIIGIGAIILAVVALVCGTWIAQGVPEQNRVLLFLGILMIGATTFMALFNTELQKGALDAVKALGAFLTGLIAAWATVAAKERLKDRKPLG
jgi:hypothetical protein